MRFIIPVLIIVLMIIGGVYSLWKFEQWMRPPTVNSIAIKNLSKRDVIYVTRNKMIMLFLIFIWIFTLISGMLGIWKQVTAPLLISVSILLTSCCVASILKKRHCNLFLGICMLYFGYLCLLATFKIGYYQFSISYWWLVGAVTFNTVISLIVVQNFVKKGKEMPKLSNKKVVPFSAFAVALVAYPIAIAISRFAKQSNVGNDVAVPVIMICLLLFALVTPFTARCLVLDDSKMFGQFMSKDEE
jgi:uncharacterized membrane protein (UPF0136 family)